MLTFQQSIIPGILQGDKSESLLYGSVDNGKKIFWNEKFHEKVVSHMSSEMCVVLLFLHCVVCVLVDDDVFFGGPV